MERNKADLQLGKYYTGYFVLVYTKTVDSVLRALIEYSISEYPALFTDSPPVPPSERRQTRVGCE